MTRSLAARLRRLWLDVHLWIGLTLLVALIVIGLTGSVLICREPLERALHAERYAVSGTAELPVEAYAAAAQAAFAGKAALNQIRLPQWTGDPVVAAGRIPGPPGPGGWPRTLNAWIDPPSGRVLAVAEPAFGFTATMRRLHGTLLIPAVGRKVVGWIGWALFASCATGLWLWWPRHGGVLRGLRWRRGGSQLFNLHHALGVWLALPLAALALTGVIISFPQTAERLVGGGKAMTMRDVQRARMAPPLAAPHTSLASAVDIARAARPDGKIRTVSWPQQGARPAWRVELAGGAHSMVAIDDASGRIRPHQAGGAPQRSPFATWSRRIHDGRGLGPAWNAVLFLCGLAPTVLGVSGLHMWLDRRGRRRALVRAG